MKKEYTSPDYEFVLFSASDVLTTGSCDNDTYYEGINTYADDDCQWGMNC